MITKFFYLLFVLYLSGCSDGNKEETSSDNNEPTILVFSKTEGFRHKSIADGIALFERFGEENNYEIIATENAGVFTDAELADVDVVVFLSTTGDILNAQQQLAFEQYIRAGGAFMGIHAATDTEYDWPWYGQLVGAYFLSHPSVQEARIEVTRRDHPATAHLSEFWIRTDEWYNFRDINAGIVPLLNIDESSYSGGENGEIHPLAWYHEFDGGKVFYTAGGHTPGSYSEPDFVQHLLGGLQYCLHTE